MSRKHWLVVGSLLAITAGCGDDGSKGKEGAGPAGGTAAAAAGVDVGAGMSAEPGGIGPGANPGAASGGAGGSADGGAAPASGASGTKAASGGPSTSGRDLFVYIPENLKLATGASIKALSDPKTVGGSQLLTQFAPVLGTLARAGLQADQIEHIWSGSNRGSGDLVICARTRSGYTAANVIQTLGASTTSEKVGRAVVHDLPSHPIHKNAVALVDPKTLMIGRRDTVIAALKNPKAGPVRAGLEAMSLSSPHYWIARDDAADNGAQRLGNFGSSDPAGLKSRGTAIGFGTGGPSATPGAGASPDAAGGTDAAGLPGGGYDPMMTGSEGGGSAQGVEIVIGLNFPSEGVATSAEAKANEAIKQLQALSTMRGMGGIGAGASQPQNPGAASPDAGANPGAVSADAGSAGTPGLPGSADMQPGSQPGQFSGKVVRNKENLRVTLVFPAIVGPVLFQTLGNALQASGATAIGDGLFDGTLASLAKATTEWSAAKPDELKGVRRIPDQPLIRGYSWMTRLLPYVGRNELFDQFDFEKSWSEGNNLQLTMNAIPAFLNPADYRTHFLVNPYMGMGLTHFVGMSGIEDRRDVIAAELPRTDPRAGMFGYDQIARPSEITDGTSQTIMMIGAGEVVAPWVQGGGATVRGARAPYFGGPGSFGSRGLEKAGTFVLFADGSARTISADIDPEVFKAMCTIHGAEQIDLSKVAPPQQ